MLRDEIQVIERQALALRKIAEEIEAEGRAFWKRVEQVDEQKKLEAHDA